MLSYKNYIAKIEFDKKAEIFHGRVINIADVVNFEGSSVTELKQAFMDSVDEYLAFYAELSEEPEKPYVGKFVLRLPPELHRKVSLAAELDGKSLNAWVTEKLDSIVKQSLRDVSIHEVESNRHS